MCVTPCAVCMRLHVLVFILDVHVTSDTRHPSFLPSKARTKNRSVCLIRLHQPPLTIYWVIICHHSLRHSLWSKYHHFIWHNTVSLCVYVGLSAWTPADVHSLEPQSNLCFQFHRMPRMGGRECERPCVCVCGCYIDAWRLLIQLHKPALSLKAWATSSYQTLKWSRCRPICGASFGL